MLIDEDGNVEAGAEGKLSEPKVPAGEIDDLDPYEIQPLNAITDQSKYEKMVEDMETEGYKGTPIVAMENGNEGYIALTGSHRIYAARRAGIDIPVVVIPQTEETVRILDDRDDGDRAMTAEELFDDNHISKKVNSKTEVSKWPDAEGPDEGRPSCRHTSLTQAYSKAMPARYAALSAP